MVSTVLLLTAHAVDRRCKSEPSRVRDDRQTVTAVVLQHQPRTSVPEIVPPTVYVVVVHATLTVVTFPVAVPLALFTAQLCVSGSMAGSLLKSCKHCRSRPRLGR